LIESGDATIHIEPPAAQEQIGTTPS